MIIATPRDRVSLAHHDQDSTIFLPRTKGEPPHWGGNATRLTVERHLHRIERRHPEPHQRIS